MKRREFTALTALSTTAGGGLLLTGASAQAQGGPIEGRQYQRLATPVPGSAPGKIEVIEFFWYGCPHCYVFEPTIEAWAKQLPSDVAYRKVHVAFRANVKIHQQLFYTLEAMGKEAQVRPAIFNAIHRGGQSLTDVDEMAKFLAPLGVDAAKFKETFKSFTVQTRCQQAEKLQNQYNIDGVPTVGIGGKFMTSPSMAGFGLRVPEEELAQRCVLIMNELVAKVRTGK
ncbi:thiol:disulfide interchange protein DsbA/DsbL [Mitsuaria sp. GD03876]|uniref:thiol:disulfide interchange protein DsbA/DsbL n=1 Tax=Mitsuaria sp. GD03876 TaxID=2975399 RepID=UPI002446DAE3|nr:thiol:disulfide interchange protein DsbA/DsbL [Mitsuaria sp. GD03876]MDH0865546.1 thiol:disulfide interchange protein DsbA/DsbL [Mitsuaria sp. GD03876]